jgi:IS30 family transposase
MKNYTHISIDEREMIFLYLGQGKGFREIGRLLGRNDRTIAREVKSNGGTTKYKPGSAQKQCELNRSNSRSKILDDTALCDFVVSKLNRGWSPEQIAGRVKLLNPSLSISHETIYKFVYSKDFKNFRYWEFLRRGHTKRQHKHARKVNRYKHLGIPNKINISKRSAEANSRSKIGHWETDLMEGTKESSKVVTVSVDRKSGYVLLDILKSKEAFPKADSLIKSLKYFPAKTITFDNGSENYRHEYIAAMAGCDTYFCNAYHSWEKGTVENTIGLIRSYVPKRTSLEHISKTDVYAIATELNSRPRKRLGYLTPYEVMYKDLTAAPQT